MAGARAEVLGEGVPQAQAARPWGLWAGRPHSAPSHPHTGVNYQEGPCVQTHLPLEEDTSDREGFSHLLEVPQEAGQEGEGLGSERRPQGHLRSDTAYIPLPFHLSGAGRGLMDRPAGTSTRGDPQTLTSHWLHPWEILGHFQPEVGSSCSG